MLDTWSPNGSLQECSAFADKIFIQPKEEKANHDSKAQKHKDVNVHVLLTVPAFSLVVYISGEVISVSTV